ncbi:MAG TPA: FAD-dependent oxidoreductase, partial [Solirubrobacteraceae bacterium]
REGAEVQDVEVEGGRVRRLRTAAGVVAPEAVVLAAGAWSGTLARRLGLRLPVTAGKGYSFTVEPVTPPRHAISLLGPHVGCSPLAGGRMRVAGTMELSGVNLRLDRRRLATIVAGAQRFLGPWRSDEPAEPWVGMRPLVPDGLPVIDRVAPGSNAYVATAYSMLGMTLALPAGRALAELVLHDRRPDVLLPFAADRFSARAALRRATCRR